MQSPAPTAFHPSWARVTWQLTHPSETVTVPDGQTVPLAGVTDTCTSSVVPVKPGVCVVPVIAVAVATAVPARAVPGVSKTPPARPAPSTSPAVQPAVRRHAALIILCMYKTLPPVGEIPAYPPRRIYALAAPDVAWTLVTFRIT